MSYLNKLIGRDGVLDQKVLIKYFEQIERDIGSNIFSKFDGDYFEVTFDSAVTTENFAHNLDYTPTDVILTYKNPGATVVTFTYESFDSSNIVITTDAACSLKMFIGRYNNE